MFVGIFTIRFVTASIRSMSAAAIAIVRWRSRLGFEFARELAGDDTCTIVHNDSSAVKAPNRDFFSPAYLCTGAQSGPQLPMASIGQPMALVVECAISLPASKDSMASCKSNSVGSIERLPSSG